MPSSSALTAAACWGRVAGSWNGCSNVDHDHDESVLCWLRCWRYAVQRREVFAADSFHQPLRLLGCIKLGPPAIAAVMDDPRNLDHLVGLIIAVGYLGGPRGAVLATAGVLIMATVARLLAQYRRRSSAPRARADVAHACTALASYLPVGQVPSAALAVAAADCNVLREGQQAHTLGGNVVAVWRQQAQHAGHRGLLELARAWQISMVQGLRHPAAAARDVRRSELQMLARAVGVRTISF